MTIKVLRSGSRQVGLWCLVLLVAASCLASGTQAGDNLLTNGGFEQGFAGWTCWGKNAKFITLATGNAHSGTNCARVQHGMNALYFVHVLDPARAYELTFFYRLEGQNPSGQIALGFFKRGGTLNSAGSQKFKLTLPAGKAVGDWKEFRQVFMASAITHTCQFILTAGDRSCLWLDDVALREVPRPAGLKALPAPFAGLERRTAEPLFKELLTQEPGGYTMVSWSHDLNRNSKQGLKSPELEDGSKWSKEVEAIFKETGEAGLGFLDLPGRLDGKEPWRTPAFHSEQFKKYGVRFDVWSEGSESVAAGVKNGAEILNPSARALGARPAVSWVDPAYVEAQARILRKLGDRLRAEPFVGYYYGKDEPSIHLPEGKPERWGRYGQAMAKEVREQYGFGRFDAPEPKEESFLKDPNRPFRWIAYNRWANEKFIETRCRLSQILHEAHPGARYSPANYCFMGGVPNYDYSRLAGCSDLMECDPYASSGERTRGRGVFNHGFGAKFLSDLTGKPVRIVAQAFDYAGYDMSPEDLREWLSQALRCGASAIDYYEMDSPRWTHPERWRMMLYLSSVVTRMNRIAVPQAADTAILYTLYTHMSQGNSASADQVYAAHALVGELAGSWFKFVSDAQLERGEAGLSGYKAVYLPLAKYMTPAAAKIVEEYVRGGGVLVCGDAAAFWFDLAGNDTAATRERILGFRLVKPREPRAQASGGEAEGVVLKSTEWGLPFGSVLPLFPSRLSEEGAAIHAWEIEPLERRVEILGTYPEGSPAIVSWKVGKGRVFAFAANPFGPQVTADASSWPAAIKGLQQWIGCKVDLPIWHFVIPAPAPGAQSL